MGKFTAPQTPIDVQGEYQKCKAEMEKAFVEYHKMFSSKVLDQNKSAAVKKTEVAVVERLLATCKALEQYDAGEGLMALATISLREELKLRDRINELEYELLKAVRDMNKLTGKTDEPKKP